MLIDTAEVRADAAQARRSLEAEVQDTDGGETRKPFTLLVHVVSGDKGVADVRTDLSVGEKLISTRNTDAKGVATHSVSARDLAGIREVTDGPRERRMFAGGPAPSRLAATLSVVARDKNDKAIGKESQSADVVPGGSAEITIRVG